jgi:hypothetical protein
VYILKLSDCSFRSTVMYTLVYCVFTHIRVTKENGFSFLRSEMLCHSATLRVTFFALLHLVNGVVCV